MIMWIVLGYLAASMMASLVFYAACVVAARADRVRPFMYTQNPLTPSESDAKRAEAARRPRLALNA